MTKEVDEAHLREVTNRAIEAVRKSIEEAYRESVEDGDVNFLTLRLDIDLNDGAVEEIDYW